MTEVYAAFLSSSSELLQDSLLNRLAARTAPATCSASKLGPKVHVEMLFVPTAAPVKTIQLGHAVYTDTTGAPQQAQGRKPRYATDATLTPTITDPEQLRGVACSIHYGGEVFCKEKSFSRKNWEFRRVPATPNQASAALAWFKKRVGDKFNRSGFFAEPVRRAARHYGVSCAPNPFSPQSFVQGDRPRWFCSELCEAGLRHSGIVTHMTPSPHPELFFQEIKQLSSVAAPIAGRGAGAEAMLF